MKHSVGLKDSLKTLLWHEKFGVFLPVTCFGTRAICEPRRSSTAAFHVVTVLNPLEASAVGTVYTSAECDGVHSLAPRNSAKNVHTQLWLAWL